MFFNTLEQLWAKDKRGLVRSSVKLVLSSCLYINKYHHLLSASRAAARESSRGVGSASLARKTLPVQRRTDDGQEDGKEDQRVDRPEGNDSKVHAEVEDLKDFGLRKREHQDPAVGQRDA